MEQTAQKLDYRWVRSNKGALAGVCKGLGDALGIETWILRVIWLIAVLWFGSGILFYLILAVCLPRVDRLDQALDRKLLGVCARISKRYQIEVGIVRTGFVLFLLVTFGAAILGYGLCYFLIPKADESASRSKSAGVF
ncbi:PspC domain-containing protein [Bdellovibrio bacteriovorus]|uniref:PspC domain-containing protein n=1 Tax=Bdellovibrio bacteriovorus TaxID=959 RepID=UPI0021CE41B2|nr:PspC domain-containing protein [Bdellovibrio bacteriovorus]UXR64144.1 PspC domain-containing protein [Bdellovibrio bacteriovorus]